MRPISKLKIFLAFIVCLMAGNLVSQDIQLTIIAPPPHPSLLSEFQESSDNYRVNITNQNAFQDYNIIIQGRLSSDNGIEARFSENFNDYLIIEIPAGSNQVFLFEELGSFFDNISIEDIDYSGGPDVGYLIQSQRLPDGIYSICLEARDFDSRELLSLPLEANCSNPIIIQSVNPPLIINPMEERVIDQVQPTLINISWTPVVAPSASIVYDLRLAEYSDLVNPYDAIENENFLQFEELDIRSNVFIYNQVHTPLIPGEKYIVRVRARDENNSVNIFNQGWSDIVVFSFGQIENEDDPNDNPVEDGDFACMSPCVSIDIPDVPAIPSINIGDIFKLGHFNLQIDNFQETVNGYSGSGIIKASDFIPKDINVSFEDVRINSNNMVTNGVVNGLRKAAAEAFPRVNTFAENSNIDEHFIDRLYDELLDPAAAMISEDINESLEEIGGALSLPISFGEGEYKIHIPDMTFTAEGATVSMLSGYELQGDYLSGSEKIVFASDNICITPGGISLTEDILKLDIVKPYDFNPSEVFGLHINGREGDNPSYIDFDCDGINEIVLNGYLAFNNEYLGPLTENFEEVNGKKLAVDYNASFTDWDEIIISASTNNNGNTGAHYFSSNFEIKALPEFKFSFANLIIDLSENENKPNMIFPSGYDSPANWTGIAIDELQMQLPDYFEDNNAAINLGLEKFIIDDSGVSFNFRAQNLQDLSDISIGGWGLSVSELRIDLLRNDIDLARLNGNIKIPICENPIGIDGRITKIDGQLDYNLNLDINEDWEVPMWACKFKCNRNSKVLAKLENNELVLKASLSGELELDDAIGDWDKIKIDKIRFEGMEISNVAPYFSSGAFDIDAVINAEFYGFNINIEDIEVSQVNRPNVNGRLPQLSFDLGFKFGKKGNDSGGLYLSTDSKLNLLGRRNSNSGSYSLEGVELERINIKSDVASVKLDGYLDIYRNHDIYGDGIGGGIDVQFVGFKTQMEANVLFGNKSNYDYWYVDAGHVFDGGIEFTPIQIRGFSGGAFYNMRQEVDLDASVGQQSCNYIPERDGWGFRAGAVWATSGEENVMNGNVGLSVDFQADGSLNIVALEGTAKMMDDPSFSASDMQETELLLGGTIIYNHGEKSVEGSFGYRMDIPRGHGIINGGRLGNRNVTFNITGIDDWNFNLGLPSSDGSLGNMLDFNLDIGCKIRGNTVGIDAGINGYFNIGTSIPPMPPLPPRAREVVGPGFLTIGGSRAGIGTGLHVAFNTGKISFGYDILGIEFNAAAGLGYDVSIANYDGFLCNGNEDFGINRWYFKGQAYLYASASLKALLFGDRYNLASASVGAYLGLAGPNPIYAKGRLRIRAKLPLIGRKTFGVGFTMGDLCQFVAIENQDEEFLNELAETVILEELEELPGGPVDFSDKDIKIRAQFFKRPEEINTERFSDNSIIQYKVQYSIALKKFVDGYWVYQAGMEDIQHDKWANGRVDIFLNQSQEHQRLLSPGGDYKLSVIGTLRYRKSYNGAFLVAKDHNNENLSIRREFTFSSTELGDYELDVLEITPAADQQYFHVGDGGLGSEGSLQMSEESVDMLNHLGYRRHANLNFKFTEFYKNINIPTGEIYSSTGSLVNNDHGRMSFFIDRLRVGYNYQLEILLEYEDEEPTILYTQTFGTSKHRTLQTKLQNTAIEDLTSFGFGPNGNRYKVKFVANENYESPYETMDISYMANNKSEWGQKRIAMEQFAQENGFLYLIRMSNPEFIQLSLNDYNPPLIGIINLNINPFDQGDPTVLKYLWRPNDYLSAIRNFAIQYYFGYIFGNAELESLFFTPYEAIQEFGRESFFLKSRNSEDERSFQTQF